MRGNAGGAGGKKGWRRKFYGYQMLGDEDKRARQERERAGGNEVPSGSQRCEMTSVSSQQDPAERRGIRNKDLCICQRSR